MERIAIDSGRCTGCGACVESCPFSAIRLEGTASIGDGCRACGLCVESCPAGAIQRVGREAPSRDLSGWRGILVFAQQQGEGFHPVVFQMLGKARELAEATGEEVYCAAVGRDINLSALAGLGVRAVYLYDAPCYGEFRSDCFGEALCHCVAELRPSTVLFGATLEARSLAPILSVRFATGLTADCTSLIMDETGNLQQIRPAFGGNIMARIITGHTRPQMATVREGVMSPAAPLGSGMPEVRRRELPPHLQASGISVLEQRTRESAGDISQAQVLLAVGRGIRRREDLPLFERLAGLLGGELACSRALVEKGWMPIHRQIGLSGRSVRPRLLITMGISGSVQFQAGAAGAERIIAIDSDPEARIFSLAHWYAVGDLYEIAPRLVQGLERAGG